MMLLGSGRECEVFALDDGRVLRRSRWRADVADEAVLMKRLHALGFPVPEVFSAAGPDLVMERIAGPTMLHAMVSGDLTFEAGARILAALHDRLHETPFVHLDLHPDNVILAEAGPVVIDWTNAREGEGDFDLAMTAVILAQVAVDEAHPMAGPAGDFLAAFLKQVSGDPLRLLPEAVARRAADDAMTPAETALLPNASALVRRAVVTTTDTGKNWF